MTEHTISEWPKRSARDERARARLRTSPHRAFFAPWRISIDRCAAPQRAAEARAPR
jgi:hypothetical protein